MSSAGRTLRLACTLGAALLGAVAAAAVPRAPNVVVILLDDLGWGDFSCFGNQAAQTPHIDRLAREGLRFEQFYVASPICSPSRAGITTGHFGRLARTLWSMPPDHGAAIVDRVLSQPALRQDWMTELSHMANRINSLRALLADRLSAAAGADYGWIAAQRGMFSRLPLSTAQVAFAREQHRLYMPPDGRINIAGVSPANVDRVAAGLIAAVRS